MKIIKILSKENATHNVMHIRTEKPEGMTYIPGQAADISVNKPDWKTKLRPFTFTSLTTDDFLEFFIKRYPEHHGVTEEIGKLNPGDSLNLGDSFGDINYQGEGIFIAGGAGITPFIAILKDLKSQNKVGNNKLIFANSTAADIIHKDFFEDLLGNHFINVLSKEDNSKYLHGYVTKEMIRQQMDNVSVPFYLCGPPPMMEAVLAELKELGIDNSKIIQEAY